MGGAVLDAVVIGAGPNGLVAAVEFAAAGYSVAVLEAADEIGGGLRTTEATLPGFRHDECSAIHPTAVLSPALRSLPLEDHGLRWVRFPVGVAHPLDDGPSMILGGDLGATAERLGPDGPRWRRLVEPFVERGLDLFADLLSPVTVPPRAPLLLARFGLSGVRSARGLATRFRTPGARGLFAGCAAHSVLPLEHLGTAAFGLLFAVSVLLEDWPCAEGGSDAIARALSSLLASHGGTIETGRRIRSLDELPPSRVVLFDTTPAALAEIAGSALPPRFGRRLRRYRMGPGAFKVDWALDGPIPWRDPSTGEASTVHVGGTLEEIADSERAMWDGRPSDRPFLIVCQQSARDRTRAPGDAHTGYAYAHVPAGSAADRTDAIERQIERFAPGFRDRILARRTLGPAELESLNPNLVGGAITGGVADLRQLVARPTLRWNPCTTPDPRIFICSASTPPGGGVHGMCGHHAAMAAIRHLRSGRLRAR